MFRRKLCSCVSGGFCGRRWQTGRRPQSIWVIGERETLQPQRLCSFHHRGSVHHGGSRMEVLMTVRKIALVCTMVRRPDAAGCAAGVHGGATRSWSGQGVRSELGSPVSLLLTCQKVGGLGVFFEFFHLSATQAHAHLCHRSVTEWLRRVDNDKCVGRGTLTGQTTGPPYQIWPSLKIVWTPPPCVGCSSWRNLEWWCSFFWFKVWQSHQLWHRRRNESFIIGLHCFYSMWRIQKVF